MDTQNEILVLDHTLKILRRCSVWPKKHTEFKPGKLFYAKFLIIATFTSLIFVCTGYHLVKAIRERGLFFFDIGILLSYTGADFMNLWFLYKVEDVAKLYVSLSDFKEFGRPPTFDERNKLLNRVSRAHYYYLNTAVSFYMFSAVYQTKSCKKTNLESGLIDNCGFMVPTWLPFDVDHNPYRAILTIYQMYCLYMVYVLSGFITFAIIESVEHVIIRIDHLNECFNDAFTERDVYKAKQKFYNAIRYHNFIFGCCKSVDMCYSGCMFAHVLLTGATLGAMGNQLVTNPTLQIVVIMVAWFLAMLYICISGQRLTEKAKTIGATICKSNWYELDLSIQKDLVLVIKKCNEPVILKAGPFGAMDFAKIVQILKTTYSYLTLISRTHS